MNDPQDADLAHDTAAPGAVARTTAAGIAETVGTVLARAATAAEPRADGDAAEIRAITEAMVRLLLGIPLRSDGKLTIKTLAEEAGLRRNKLTHKHTGLKDLFYALVATQDARPLIADSLKAANDELTSRVKRITAERDRYKRERELLARIVHVLEFDNDQLRAGLHAGTGVADLTAHRRSRAGR